MNVEERVAPQNTTTASDSTYRAAFFTAGTLLQPSASTAKMIRRTIRNIGIAEDIAGHGGSRLGSFRILKARLLTRSSLWWPLKNLPHYRHWPPVFIMYFRAMELKLQPENCPCK